MSQLTIRGWTSGVRNIKTKKITLTQLILSPGAGSHKSVILETLPKGGIAVRTDLPGGEQAPAFFVQFAKQIPNDQSI